MPVDLASFTSVSSFFVLLWLLILRVLPVDWLTIMGLVIFAIIGMASSDQMKRAEEHGRTRKKFDAHK